MRAPPPRPGGTWVLWPVDPEARPGYVEWKWVPDAKAPDVFDALAVLSILLCLFGVLYVR